MERKEKDSRLNDPLNLLNLLNPSNPLNLLNLLNLLNPSNHCWKQDKNQDKPLMRMEGDALVPKLPPWSYKSNLLTPKPKTCVPPSS